MRVVANEGMESTAQKSRWIKVWLTITTLPHLCRDAVQVEQLSDVRLLINLEHNVLEM